MPKLLYIHGFLSSPQSYKAKQIQQYLQQYPTEIDYVCPLLTPYPKECERVLTHIVESTLAATDPLYLMGSSMGGFWATYLAERYDLPAILINPAVDVLELMPPYLNQPLHNYHTDDVYCLKTDDLAQLSRYDTPVITRPQNYWVLLQTGDETLDYRLAEKRYRDCKQTIEQGGDHSYQDFERFHLPALQFFETFYYTNKS
jgi:uncharacterized protein